MTAVGTRPDPGRLTGWRGAAAWLVVALDALLIMSTAAVPGMPIVVVVLLVLGAILSFGIVGAIVVTRLPRNPIGWIPWATAGVIAGSVTGASYASYSVAAFGGTLPATVPIALASQADLIPTLGLVGIFLPLTFPDGHLPSTRWRGVARFSAAAIVFASVLAAVTPGPLSGGSNIENPIGIPALAGAGPVVGLLPLAALVSPFLLAVASVIVRYRHAGAVERQQLKWFAGAAAVMVIAVVLGSSNIGPLAEVGWIVMIAGLALLPIAVGVAVLRYRLYDIDRIISRTVSYGAVTGILAVVFVGTILVSQTVLASFFSGSSVAVAASTLVVAALFQPLRRRVQGVVDRRFNRSRYDAERMVSAFAGRLRDEVALADVDAAIRTVVAQTVAPKAVGLWMRERGPS
ncbi:MAG: hypothetical protein ACXWXA_02975 [Candidatus Limnocylindrales bacterium]